MALASNNTPVGAGRRFSNKGKSQIGYIAFGTLTNYLDESENSIGKAWENDSSAVFPISNVEKSRSTFGILTCVQDESGESSQPLVNRRKFSGKSWLPEKTLDDSMTEIILSKWNMPL